MSTPQQIAAFTRNTFILNGLLNNLPDRDQKHVPSAPVFVHPILIPGDFKKTISNYRQHIQEYNDQVNRENASIKEYNKEVATNRRNAKISIKQKFKEQLWKEALKDHTPEEFNEAVEEYNSKHGLQLRKKHLRLPVKPDSEKYFMAFLYQYNAQLYRRKEERIKLEVHVHGELPKLEIYPNKIIEAEIDGSKILEVSVETVRHHRERLQEAGVLTGYSYHGPNRPVKMTFNPTILSITDNGSPKNTFTENQPLTQSQTNKVPHNNVSSRTYLNKFKLREEGDLQKSKSVLNCTKESTKTPKRQEGKNPAAPNHQNEDLQKKFTGPREISDGFIKKGIEFLAEKNELSAILMDQITDKTELAQGLAAGKYKNYRPISASIIQSEAYLGAMHPEDFKELAIQDIFKFSNGLFKDLEVHPGSWMNAYKYWLADYFQSFTGQTFKKSNLMSRWLKCIEVLREVKKYKKAHPGWNPSFPSLYFDPARTFKENNSFEYAIQNFRMDLGKITSLKKRKVAAANSSRHKTDLQKAREKVRQMLKGIITLDRVYEYTRQNLNKQVYKGLNNLIKKETALLEKEITNAEN